jgi:hypothetical protein
MLKLIIRAVFLHLPATLRGCHLSRQNLVLHYITSSYHLQKPDLHALYPHNRCHGF